MGTSVKPQPNGMASSAAALRYWERRQEVAANNLANVSTDGFKGERVFSRLVEGALPVPDAVTDFSPGTLQPTGNPYDVAIDGRGFFVVQTANGERLSRGGTLHISQDGTLVDAAGNALMGEHGPVQITTRGMQDVSSVQITSSGVVRVNDTDIDQLRLETIPPHTSLTREGNGLFVPPQHRVRMGRDTAVVRQGAIEESNVTPVSEMVDMIAIQRAYTAVEKAMTTLDATRGVATTELGRPMN
jgi:flagellar basal body rod protein FlgG